MVYKGYFLSIYMERLEQNATDIEIAVFLAYHIENPCGIIIDGKRVDIRDFYIREARETFIPSLTNPFARKFLEDTIKKYD
jgi:hypothetical protein